MGLPEYLIIFGGLGALILFIGTVVMMALKIKAAIDNGFRDNRKLMYQMFKQRDRAIRRLEFWAVREWRGFQPGVDDPALVAEDVAQGNGSQEQH